MDATTRARDWLRDQRIYKPEGYVETLAAAIRSAESDERAKCEEEFRHVPFTKHVIAEAVTVARREARAAALEEAAKVAEAMADRCEETASRILSEDVNDYSEEAQDELAYSQTLQEAADRIRRLASQETP